MIPAGWKLHDVTRSISETLPVWPGDPNVTMADHLRTANGDACNVTRLGLTSHTGTHVDAPWHFVDQGKRLDEIPVERWVGDAFVVRIPDGVTRVEPADLETAGIPAGTERVIFRTSNCNRWGDADVPFFTDYVALSPDAARWVVDHGIKLVGIDALSIESFDDAAHGCHLTLLGNDVIIIEGLDLRKIDPGPCQLICLPLKLDRCDGAPARVLIAREGN